MINTLITVYIDKLKTNKLHSKILLYYYNKNIDKSLYNYYMERELTLKDIQNKMEEYLNDKEKYGIVFTPINIVDEIIDKTINDFKNPIICDLSCGNGAFLVPSTIKISKSSNKTIIETIEENIYGVDILEENIINTKIILSLLALSYGEDKENIQFNLYNDDGLSKNLFIKNKFDCIIGNPPYVQLKKMNKKYVQKVKKTYSSLSKGNSNIYFAFIEQFIGEYLKEEGISGLIIPNSIATSLNAEPIRKILSYKKNHIKEVIDFKDKLIFENAKIYTAIYILTKKHNPKILYNNYDVSLENFNYKQWSFLSSENEQNILKIQSCQNKLNIKGGISTNCDKLYLIKDVTLHNDNYYQIIINKKTYQIEKDMVIDFVKVGNYKKIKIIYPYNIKDEEEFKNKYPQAYNYFLEMKDILEKRDMQGNEWYKYARKQGLTFYQYKLLFSKYNKKPNFIKNCDKILFSSGFSIVCDDKQQLELYYKVLNSIIMEYYIENISSSIENGYLCYQKNILQNFTIPDFTQEEISFLLTNQDKNIINNFLINKYNLKI